MLSNFRTSKVQSDLGDSYKISTATSVIGGSRVTVEISYDGSFDLFEEVAIEEIRSISANIVSPF